MRISFQASHLVIAITVAATMSAAPSFADGVAYPALDNPLRNQLLSSGVDDDGLSALTQRQIAEIAAVLHTTDGSADRSAAARAIVERAARNDRLSRPAGGSPHAAQLVAGVAQSLGAAGIHDVDPAALSLDTVQRLSMVLSEHDSGGRAAAARAILDEGPRRAHLARTIVEVPGAGENARVVVGKISSLGITVADPEALTLGQLAEISAIYGLNEGASDRAAAIRRILGM